jgi:hypothetical protein
MNNPLEGATIIATHTGSGLVIHADGEWAGGNSSVGLAVAANLYRQGKPTPCHLIHGASDPCEVCPR